MRNWKGLVAIGFAVLGALLVAASMLSSAQAGHSLASFSMSVIGIIMGAVSLTLSLAKTRVARTAMWILIALATLTFVTAFYLPPMWLVPEQRIISQTTGWHQVGFDTWEAEWETFTYTCYRGNIKLDFEYGCYWAWQTEKALQTNGLLPNPSPVSIP